MDCAFSTEANCKKFWFVLCSFLVWDFHEHFCFCVIFVSPTTSPVLVEICDSFVERGYLSVSCSNCFSLLLLLLFSRLTRALLWIVRNSVCFFFPGVIYSLELSWTLCMFLCDRICNHELSVVEICDACEERSYLSVSWSDSFLFPFFLSFFRHWLLEHCRGLCICYEIFFCFFLVWNFHEHFCFCVIFVSATTSPVS